MRFTFVIFEMCKEYNVGKQNKYIYKLTIERNHKKHLLYLK